MSQDVNNDWVQREFVESVELSLRKCVNFLNHFQESASYRLSHIDGRLTSLERNLDFIEAQLKHANPEERGGSGTAFKKSVFDPETRRDMKQRAYDLRIRPRGFTKKVIAPMKRKGTGMIIAGAGAKAGGAGMVRAGPGAKAPKSTSHQTGEGAAPSKASAAASSSSSSSAGPGASAEGAPAKATAEGPGAAGSTPGAAGGAATSAAASTTTAKGPGASGESASAVAAGGGGEGEAAVFPHGKADQIDFRAVQAGSGPRPAPTSKVDIAYTVYLSDGKELLTHRETVSLGVKQNIKGLELGLLRMNTGMKAKLWVPYRLGYGPKGAGDMIPPAADLTFDIELIAIVEM